jgi:hypothetical protein
LCATDASCRYASPLAASSAIRERCFQLRLTTGGGPLPPGVVPALGPVVDQ